MLHFFKKNNRTRAFHRSTYMLCEDLVLEKAWCMMLTMALHIEKEAGPLEDARGWAFYVKNPKLVYYTCHFNFRHPQTWL